MNIAYCDLETPFIPKNGNILDINRIFCIGIAINDGPVQVFTDPYLPHLADGSLKMALSILNLSDLAVFHNGLKFDVPILRNLLGKLTVPVHDTLLLAKLTVTQDQLFAMDAGIKDLPKTLYGSYSLGAFGYRLGNNKGDFKDFTKLSLEMVEYLKQDVIVTRELYNVLTEMENFPPPIVIQLENDVAEITFQQERNGFHFNIEMAKELNTKLLFERYSLDRKLQKQFRPMLLPDGPLQTTNKLLRRKLYIPSKQELKW